MNISVIHDTYSLLRGDKLSFIYRGTFSNATLSTVTDLITRTLNNDSKGFQHKLSYLMVESFQNLTKYSETKRTHSTNDLFILRNILENYFITTVNLINNEKRHFIGQYLKKLNELDSTELKNLYLEVLTNQRFTEKGGAGLGFIEMIRKSKNKLLFDFVPFDNFYSYFYFQIQIKLSKNSNKTVSLPLAQTKILFDNLKELNALLVQKADFGNKLVIPFVKIIKNNVRGFEKPVEKKFFSILVELLQDMSFYTMEKSGKKDAIFIMGKKNEKYFFIVGSEIYNNLVEKRLKCLEEFMSLKKQNLERLYYDALVSDKYSEENLRILKILKSINNYDYSVLNLSDQLSFFVQKVEF